MNDAMVPVVTRRLSGLERTWVVADRIQAPFVINLVIEGEGALSTARLEQAVSAAARMNPGSSLRLEGVLRGSRWCPGYPPVFRVVEAAGWDGESERGAPFLEDVLTPNEGPTVEVIKVDGGARTRLIVRAHHAVMDGEGMWVFASDLFAALRGEALRGSVAGPLTDYDLALEVVEHPIEEPPIDKRAPTGRVRDAEAGSMWRCVRLEGKRSEVLPRAMVAIWKASRPYTTGSLRFGVPVDLRRYRPGLRSTANLTGVMRVELDDGREMGTAIQDLRRQLVKGLEAHDAAGQVLRADGMRGLPIWLLAFLGRCFASSQLRKETFAVSATVSNLGLRDLREVSVAGFEATRVFWVPPGTPSMPLFVTLSGDVKGVNLLAMTPRSLGSDGRLDDLVASICDEM